MNKAIKSDRFHKVKLDLSFPVVKMLVFMSFYFSLENV